MAESDWVQWMTVLGLLIDHRIFLYLRSSCAWAILPYRPELRLMYFGLSWVITEWHLESITVGVALQGLMIASLIASRFVSIRVQEDRLRQSFQGWMENLLLKMQMGSSFRSAFGSCLSRCSDQHLKALLARQELGFQMIDDQRGNGSTPHCSAPFFSQPFQRMTEIEAAPHRAQPRLEALIQSWHQELWFRRRSRQAARQSQVQLWFLVLMYAILLIWSAHRYPGDRLWPSLRFSFSLVACGTILLLFMSRERKWKI